MALSDLDSFKVNEACVETGIRHIYRHQIVYRIPQVEIEDYREDFSPSKTKVTTLPGGSGLFTPRLRQYQLDREFPGQPGFARLALVFRTPTWHELVEEYPNRAVLEVDVSAYTQRVLKEPDGLKRIIEGPDAPWEGHDAEANMRWKVVKGTNLAYLPKCLVRVTATALTFDRASIMQKVGKLNGARLRNFGNAKRGTLLFIGAKAKRGIGSSDYWRVEYLFLCDPNGWDTQCDVQRFVKAVVSTFKYDIDDDGLCTKSATHTMDMVLDFPEPDGDGNPIAAESRNIRGENPYTSFADLDHQLAWYD